MAFLRAQLLRHRIESKEPLVINTDMISCFSPTPLTYEINAEPGYRVYMVGRR